MFDNLSLIKKQESKKLFLKQSILIDKWVETMDSNVILQIALLQTLIPICDTQACLEIMKAYETNNFEYLIIGAYISTEVYNGNDDIDNIFLMKLLKQYSDLNAYQQSVVKYLLALQTYNNDQLNNSNALSLINEAIELCDKYVSHLFLRYLITQNGDDLNKAKNNVTRKLSDKEISLLQIEDLVNPSNYIKEHILMTSMSYSSFNRMFKQYGISRGELEQ